MEQIITITQNAAGDQVVSARHLHEVLEVETRYNDWIARRLDHLVEGIDYVGFTQKVKKPQGGRPHLDVALSLDAAKQLSMMENTQKSRQVRLYFIEVEKEYRRARVSMTPTEILVEQAQNLLRMERAQAALQQAQREQEAALQAVTSKQQVLQHQYVNNLYRVDYYSLTGYYKAQGQKCPPTGQLSQLGKQAARVSQAMGVPVQQTKHVKWGQVNVYHQDVLRAVLGF